MTIGDLLNVAIQHELKSQILYKHLSTVVSDASARDFLLELVEEERSHERRLHALKASGEIDTAQPLDTPDVADEIARGHAVYVTLDEHSSMDDIVQLAIRREQRAAQLFQRLAASSTTPAIRALFLQLAEEESGHEQQVISLFSSDPAPDEQAD
ncbi:MAG: ferritin family protein [Ignavibacteria bacterium]|nr:ferritin family protein [Ignavibacteria bacterium]